MLGHLGEVFPEANVGHNFSQVAMRSLWFTWYKYYETIPYNTGWWFRKIGKGYVRAKISGDIPTMPKLLYDILVGGWPTPLKKYEFVSWDDDIPNIWKNWKNVWNHQPVLLYWKNVNSTVIMLVQSLIGSIWCYRIKHDMWLISVLCNGWW